MNLYLFFLPQFLQILESRAAITPHRGIGSKNFSRNRVIEGYLGSGQTSIIQNFWKNS